MTQRPALPLLALLNLAACRNVAPEPPAPPAQASAPTTRGAAVPGATPHAAPHAGTLRWADPASWRRGTPSSAMRKAQYAVPGPDGDGELTVFWFGAGMGGSIENNLSRWYGQFEQPDGRPSASVATRETRTVRGLNVTITRVQGRFAGGGMGAPGAAPEPARDNYALLAAIVETPNGPWFFKLTGPRSTLAGAAPAFDDLVASFDFR